MYVANKHGIRAEPTSTHTHTHTHMHKHPPPFDNGQHGITILTFLRYDSSIFMSREKVASEDGEDEVECVKTESKIGDKVELGGNIFDVSDKMVVDVNAHQIVGEGEGVTEGEGENGKRDGVIAVLTGVGHTQGSTHTHAQKVSQVQGEKASLALPYDGIITHEQMKSKKKINTSSSSSSSSTGKAADLEPIVELDNDSNDNNNDDTKDSNSLWFPFVALSVHKDKYVPQTIKIKIDYKEKEEKTFDTFYWNRFSQKIQRFRPEDPSCCRGGILADEMGMGKRDCYVV